MSWVFPGSIEWTDSESEHRIVIRGCVMEKRDPGPDTPQPRPEEDHHPMPTPDIEPDPADEEECDR